MGVHREPQGLVTCSQGEQGGSSDHQACSYPCPLAKSSLDPRRADPASPTASSLGPCGLGRPRGGGGTSSGRLDKCRKAWSPRTETGVRGGTP